MTVYIAEFERLPSAGGTAQIAPMPPIAEQTRSVSGTSAQSSAFNANTRFIRVHTDGICSIAIGANPTATTSLMRLPADATEYFAVQPGHLLAAITNT